MYVDGFVAAVPADRIADYQRLAQEAADVWLEHGALGSFEAVEDDVPEGVVTSFPMAVKREPGELVVFAFILYRDRDHRDAVNRAVEADPRMRFDDMNRVFDGKRMIWGGFRPLVQTGILAKA
jgi:uncharacterized protein YbaA (DUF1428 family)